MKDHIKRVSVWIAGALFAVVVAIGVFFWMANSFVDHQIDNVKGAAHAVTDTVNVVVEKGEHATEILTSGVEKVGTKVKSFFESKPNE